MTMRRMVLWSGQTWRVHKERTRQLPRTALWQEPLSAALGDMLKFSNWPPSAHPLVIEDIFAQVCHHVQRVVTAVNAL